MDRNKKQVLHAVVELVSIYVMNLFVRAQGATKLLFHNVTMLNHSAPSHIDDAVSLTAHPAALEHRMFFGVETSGSIATVTAQLGKLFMPCWAKGFVSHLAILLGRQTVMPQVLIRHLRFQDRPTYLALDCIFHKTSVYLVGNIILQHLNGCKLQHRYQY